jgi:diacylglycerol kinase
MSLTYALKGVKEIYKSQRNFRIQTNIGLLVMLTAFLLDLPGTDILWLSFATMIVLVMEGLNTTIEKIMDFINPDYNPVVGIIKDISAALVLIAAAFSVVIAVVIFGNAIFGLSSRYGIIIAIIFLASIKILSRKKGGEDSGKKD